MSGLVGPNHWRFWSGCRSLRSCGIKSTKHTHSHTKRAHERRWERIERRENPSSCTMQLALCHCERRLQNSQNQSVCRTQESKRKRLAQERTVSQLHNHHFYSGVSLFSIFLLFASLWNQLKFDELNSFHFAR